MNDNDSNGNCNEGGEEEDGFAEASDSCTDCDGGGGGCVGSGDGSGDYDGDRGRCADAAARGRTYADGAAGGDCACDNMEGRNEGRKTRNPRARTAATPASDKPHEEGLSLTRSTDCAKCAGTGRVPSPGIGLGFCTHCAGERFVEETVRFLVLIPPGADDGYTQVRQGKGHVKVAGEDQSGWNAKYIFGGSLLQHS